MDAQLLTVYSIALGEILPGNNGRLRNLLVFAAGVLVIAASYALASVVPKVAVDLIVARVPLSLVVLFVGSTVGWVLISESVESHLEL